MSPTLNQCSLFLAAVCGTMVHSCAQTFVDVALTQGVNELILGDGLGSGLSTYDFDKDGWDDLTLCNSNDSLIFYKNINGQFVRSRSFVDGPGVTKHTLWVDYDNDGDMDLTVTTWEGTYRLYANDGAFNFTDVSEAAGLAQYDRYSYGASWGDYDRDGDLDLYVCLYDDEGDPDDLSRMNHLYKNVGDGTFVDVSVEAGVSDGLKMSFQSVWMDYDNDGWLDLFVINDRWYPNSMYHNEGDGTFIEVGEMTGTRLANDDPMTATVTDFDHDGDLDIYMTNTGLPTGFARLLVNNGDGTFDERGAELGTDLPYWSWGATWVDVDNDSWEDLYVTTELATYDHFYQNLGGVQFEENSDLFLDLSESLSFAVGRLDLENDGDYDIAVKNHSPSRPFLWQNQGNSNHFIKINLRGTASDRSAIGSWIKVFANGEQYTQFTFCGENYVSQNSQHHIFGLRDATIVDSVQVHYVRGHIDTYHDLAVDQTYTFTEGETYQASITTEGSLAFCQGGSVVLDAGEHSTYLWNTGATGRYLTISSGGIYWATVTSSGSVQVNTDTVEVVVRPEPLISSSTENPQCFGESTGAIALVDLSGIEMGSILWSTGGTEVQLNNIGAGSYSYTYTSIHGCMTTGSIQLTEPPELFVLSTTTPATAGANGTLQVLVFGGVPPYSVSLNGVIIGQDTTGLAAGNYDLLITDDQGCEFEEQVVVELLTGISQQDTTPLLIFPNPVRSGGSVMLSLPRTLMEVQLELIDGQGRMVRKSFHQNVPEGILEYPLAEHSSGLYLLRLTSPSFQGHVKLHVE
jgi:hypothetical protein